MEFGEIAELIGIGIDAAGIAVIVVGILLATVFFFASLRRDRSFDAAYQHYREGVGRSLLLGLEFLVAADIIRTVAVAPNFYNLGILAVIVAIRTFLSWSLELELEGRWPWQARPAAPPLPSERAEATGPPERPR